MTRNANWGINVKKELVSYRKDKIILSLDLLPRCHYWLTICLPVRRCKRHGSIPGSGRSPGGGHGNPLQYACLENPTDRGAWQATVHRVVKSQIQLKWLNRDRHAHLMRTAVKNPGIFSPFFPFLQFAHLLDQKGWFWLQGPNLWKSIFPQTLVGGMVWGWFKHITFTVHFIPIVTSAPPQLIRC